MKDLKYIYLNMGGLACGKDHYSDLLLLKVAKSEVRKEYGFLSYIFMKSDTRKTLVKHMFIYIKDCLDI